MDLITMDELKSLLTRYPGWCVSLFMPTHRSGRETEQDPIRFRNLLRKAEERLQAKGLRTPEVLGLLKPAQSLLQEPGFWRQQSDGLAVFISPELFKFYRLPLRLEELVVVGNRFHLKPLLPFFASDGHFYILALSQNQVRLLEGSRHTVDEIDLEGMPKSLAETLQYERFEKQVQFHTRTPTGKGDRAAVFHGHDPSDEDKGRILRWFRKIDGELPRLLKEEQAPVVLAGVEYLISLYNEASSYPFLLDKGIPGNPEELKPEALHTRAWDFVQPYFSRAQEDAAAQYRQLAGTGRTSTDVKEVLLAAHHGRVETLFVALGVQVWGSFDPEANTIHLHQDAEPGDEDLLDLAAAETISKGGAVFPLEQKLLPDQGYLAAVFRF